jgi:lysylphosphatidylglycerol synthetase-like protein (DUF2156 family)
MARKTNITLLLGLIAGLMLVLALAAGWVYLSAAPASRILVERVDVDGGEAADDDDVKEFVLHQTAAWGWVSVMLFMVCGFQIAAIWVYRRGMCSSAEPLRAAESARCDDGCKGR